MKSLCLRMLIVPRAGSDSRVLKVIVITGTALLWGSLLIPRVYCLDQGLGGHSAQLWVVWTTPSWH